MKAVVLCAGYGTRLGPLTRETPKPMLPLAGRPMLEHILRHLVRHGYDEVAVNLHFQPEVITSYFGDGSSVGVRLRYFPEPDLLGTAGALRGMSDFLADAPDFLVQYGDVITNEDLSAMRAAHAQKGAAATILVHERASSNSVVALDQTRRVVGFLERPTAAERATLTSSWVNSGIALFSRQALGWIPDQAPSDIPRHMLVPRVKQEKIFAHPLSGYRCAIDSPERYAMAEAALAGGKVFDQ